MTTCTWFMIVQCVCWCLSQPQPQVPEHAGKGRADAKAWAKASGALSVVKPGAEKDVASKADQQSEDYTDLEEAQPSSNPVQSVPEAAVVQGKAASTKADSPRN